MIGKKINQLATELAPVSTDLTIIGDPTTGVSKKITLAQLGAIFSGAVSFYTNLAGFPATGDINVIYCAKDTQKLYLWSGSAYVEVFPSQALLDTYQLRSEKGNANGYASLDSQGKVPISQLPSSIMEYKGTWNAATNTPTLANGTGDTGDVYICNVAGTVNFGAGPITFAVGDYVIYSGTIWQRSSGAVGTVTSVAASITGNSVTISGSPVTTSGTLAFAFAGTGAQYIKGDGTLATFPSTIAQAERLITEVYNSTGATLTKGTVVYINGGQGNLPTVTKAIATGDSTSAQTFGIVQADITNNNNGFVVIAGKITDIDTQAYTEGTQLYLSSTTAGAYTSTKQYAPAHLVYVGIIVRSHPTQGIIEVKIQNGYELDELHNVAAQTPSNNDGLFYESSTSLWKNKSIATILGYTPQAQLNGTGFVKASGTTISYDNSTYVTTDTFQTISASKTFSVGFSIASAGGTNQISVFQNTNSLFSGSGGSNIFGFNSANNIYFGKGLDNGGVLQWNNSAVRYYTLPDATGTIALVGGSGVGTVTSVGLSSATSGVTIGSTPITTSGTITLAIDTASGSQQGLLSSTDWTTFNNKQNALTNPVTGTGTTNYLPKFTGASTIGNSQVFDNGTNVGIGTATPSYKLDVSGAIQTSVASGNGSLYINNSSLSGKFWTLIPETASGETNLLWYYGGAGASVKMNLTNTGNLGLGVTPSAWNSIYKAFELATGSIHSSSSYNNIAVAANIFYNAANSPRYIVNDYATMYYQYQGSHAWYSAPSGTAGNAISFTQAMTLDASGRLGVGTTSLNNLITFNQTIGGSPANLSELEPYATVKIKGRPDRNNIVYVGAIDSTTGMLIQSGTTSTAANLAINPFGGNVGIGTTSPGSLLHTSGSSNIFKHYTTANNGTWVEFQSNSAGRPFYVGQDNSTGASFFGAGYAGLIVTGAADPIVFGTNSTERMRITSAGNVGIGTSSPLSGVGFGLQITSPVGQAAYVRANYTGFTGLDVIQGGDGTGYLYLRDNNDLRIATNNTERMRITSGGNVLVNNATDRGYILQTNSNSSTGAMEIRQNNAAGDIPLTITNEATSGTRSMITFQSGGYGVAGTITSGNTSTSYNTSSDYRLKQDIKDFNGLDLVSKLKAYDYEWKADKSRSYGVIAHELQSVINYAVTGVKDGKEMQGVDYSKIVPVLIKAIQEQQAQIEQLKNK